MATRKKLTAAELRVAVFKQKAHVYSLSQKIEELLIYERLSDRDKDELNSILFGHQRMYGSVEYSNWLRAVIRIQRRHFTNVGPVLVSPVILDRKQSAQAKRQFLQVMAVQMGVDVTVTLNKRNKASSSSH